MKDVFNRAIESGKVKELRAAFKKHLHIEDRFVKKDGKSGWKKVSLYGYECWRFATESGDQGQSAIVNVLREVWGNGSKILTDKDDVSNLPLNPELRGVPSASGCTRKVRCMSSMRTSSTTSTFNGKK